MRLKLPTLNLLLSGAAIIASMALASCSTDQIEIPKDELFTREFIKQFGVPDPDHDWNQSHRATVTVTTAKPTQVKIYADVKGSRYLFGTFLGVNGSQQLGVDIPKGVDKLIVRANGLNHIVSPGASINLASRALNVGESGTNKVNGVTITLLPDQRVDEDGNVIGVNYLTIDPDDQTKFKEVVNEDNSGSHSDPSTTNLQKDGVTENFVAKAKTFWIFPEYWDTGSYTTNTIGVYYYADQTTQGATKIVDINGNSSWVVKVPIYTPEEGKSIVNNLYYATGGNSTNLSTSWTGFNELIYKTLEAMQEDNSLPVGWSLDEADGTDKYKDQYNNNFTSGKKLLKTSADGAYIDYSTWYNFYIALNNLKDPESAWRVIYKAATKAYPNYIWKIKYNGYNWDITYIDPEKVTEELVSGQQASMGSVLYYKSKGVEVTFDAEGLSTFGFYIERGGKTKFSEARFNETLSYTGPDDETITTQACYVCTFVQGTDTYGNTLRRLCFEDWWSDATSDESGKPGTASFGNNTNFDMNDMVFRVYGFDEQIDETVPEGTIDDTPEDEDEDIPYEWVVAAEDLGNTEDFDFNDVVFGVGNFKIDENGTATVTVHALASGGTLPVYLYHNNKQIGGEFHSWFGKSSNQVVNAGATASETGASYIIEVEADFSMSCCQTVTGEPSNMGGFTIKVEGTTGGTQTTITAPNLDTNALNYAPQMICVPTDWQWPQERVHINNAYSQFQTWVADQNTHINWHETPNLSNVTKRTDIQSKQ